MVLTGHILFALSYVLITWMHVKNKYLLFIKHFRIVPWLKRVHLPLVGFEIVFSQNIPVVSLYNCLYLKVKPQFKPFLYIKYNTSWLQQIANNYH